MGLYRLSEAAERDTVQLLAYTESNFGEIARLRYERLLATALRDIADDPERFGSIVRAEIGSRVRSYHLRHRRDRARSEHGIVQCPRHLLLYRVGLAFNGIGRVLHDAMELERHLPTSYGDD
ncbi:type II toxin-antitoxin system RelE/ParE family toxin [Mesorhizobium sp. VK23B]|uniref:Type II toxin-antitoxin system RelE/ParE family toxin n=1 Tax=Mesorhizobium dulcispinae TaxID=3072316 RepID=A0ABU4XQH7_9HYPH|nr:MULTISPECIES: type II toxin-antitoxin system RelE/ParE family toxin [unclassified Mesorhizobium]MDX8469543.1 type II toxin-antitoxin system RelE/ParE family toxin [Mesorhizobium sp. VK23B]MDX8475882.1 type II toxin-antitoxin system RelE/ParE family toxin [Mesorhizobium sp. VK23A]